MEQTLTADPIEQTADAVARPRALFANLGRAEARRQIRIALNLRGGARVGKLAKATRLRRAANKVARASRKANR